MSAHTMASPAGQRIVLPSINTILPSWTRDYHPDSGYSSASDDDMPLKPLSIDPALLKSPYAGRRARKLSTSSRDSRLSTSPSPSRTVQRMTAADFVPLRTPSPPPCPISAISRHKQASPMRANGDRSFTVSLPTPAAAQGVPAHIRLVPVHSLDEADAAVLVRPSAREDEKPRSLLLVGPENLRRVRRGASTFDRNVRVHPYRIVRVATSPAST